MRYYVYCDAAHSHERGMGAWSFLIFTDVRYIYWDYNKSRFIKTPTFAEDVALGMACHWIIHNRFLSPNDTIIFHSDSLSTINYMKSYISGEIKYKAKDILVTDAVTNVLELSKLCNVEFVKVRGHKVQLSPNVCVDRMVKYSLRS